VFRVIDRFSEDIDLSLSPEFWGLSTAGATRTQANKWMDKAEAACAVAVNERIRPKLEEAVQALLGQAPGSWFEFVTDETTHSPVLLFHYPSSQQDGFEYLKRSVKLEFGSLTDQQPTGRHAVQPMIVDIFPKEFDDWRCEVVALELERTFWEKATILHAEYHRPADRSTPDRFSRHYADTAALAQHAIAATALNDDVLRERVVAWKSQFFGSGWVRYELAKPGTFRLVPPAKRLATLKRDYEAIKDMYLSEPAAFDEVKSVLKELEQRINDRERGAEE
jgi:hypothetical protein